MAADSREKQAEDATADKQKECDVLKKLIGFPERSTEEIEKQFAEDMADLRQREEVGCRNPTSRCSTPDTLFYSRLLAGMYKIIQDRTDELIQSRADVADLQTQFKNREESKDDAITSRHGRLRQGGRSRSRRPSTTFSSGQQATAEESKRNLEVAGASQGKRPRQGKPRPRRSEGRDASGPTKGTTKSRRQRRHSTRWTRPANGRPLG